MKYSFQLTKDNSIPVTKNFYEAYYIWFITETVAF